MVKAGEASVDASEATASTLEVWNATTNFGSGRVAQNGSESRKLLKIGFKVLGFRGLGS